VWELICHHTYKWQGLPVDLSPQQRNGRAQGAVFAENGAGAGSGTLRFNGSARVSLPAGGAWTRLRAIKIECLARVTLGPGLPLARCLIEGDGSFSFGLMRDGPHPTLWLFAALTGTPQAGVSSFSDTPDGFPAAVPTNTWVTLALVHDGIDAMELYLDGAMIARRRGIERGVPGVGPVGVTIGNDFAGGTPLRGEIDEIKVWRLDPHQRLRQFLARPMDEATADCWERYLLRVREALATNTKCARFPAELEAFYRRALRIVVADQTKRNRLLDLRRRYDALWRAGEITGPEMRAVIRELHNLFEAAGLVIASDGEFDGLIQSDCMMQIAGHVGAFDCDPRFIAMFEAAADELGLG
jgi:Concanavalin A-like lectin/glucanases superfamily